MNKTKMKQKNGEYIGVTKFGIVVKLSFCEVHVEIEASKRILNHCKNTTVKTIKSALLYHDKCVLL